MNDSGDSIEKEKEANNDHPLDDRSYEKLISISVKKMLKIYTINFLLMVINLKLVLGKVNAVDDKRDFVRLLDNIEKLRETQKMLNEVDNE